MRRRTAASRALLKASVRVSRGNGVAVIEIAVDGVGGADESAGTGLQGLADRVEALGLVAVASALATRLPFVINLVLCLVIYFLGHLAPDGLVPDAARQVA